MHNSKLVEISNLEIYLLVGFSASGKSTIAKHLSNYGFGVIECGDIVRQFLIQNDWKKSTSEFHEYMKKTQGNTYLFADINSEIIRLATIGVKKIVILGIRTYELFELLIKTYNIKHSIFIESEIQSRFQRYIKSQNNRIGETVLNLSDFGEQDKLHCKWGLKKIKNKCNHIITNDNTINNFVKSFSIKFNVPYG